jgi:hypothetical protein
MHYGVNLPTIVNAQTLVLLAAEAEAAGWDGVFVWDTLYGNPEHEPEKQEIYDPWITLGSHRHVYQACPPRDYGNPARAAASLESGPRDRDARSSVPGSANPSGWIRINE